ncbi:ABC transporter substrate-binding protein [Methylobacterium nodulans]|uniref:Extracellular solute-binding protein family 3 n=1 Tax=Methylobacterium nodulans (strain LMG 21967 / CNCM I-2342 / ORS 2060) TaxID=460265 RepID=B8IWB8_METNO|nr:ABC transporter substrate-binding protein [Methylobacterium nodulans]ACL62708.1 extracellular solute-binding protein family 3 [Methylobacterium nodulans ORS 2060]
MGGHDVKTLGWPTDNPLRVAINLGNSALAREDCDGQLRGIAVDLAFALGDWLGSSIRLVIFPSAGAVMKAVDEDESDVAFLAIDPARADRVAYTRPYLLIEGVFAVREASPMRDVGDVDRPRVRIASAAGAAYHSHLTLALQHAELVTVPTPGDALRRLGEGACDVAAGVRQAVEDFANQCEGIRVLPSRFMAIEQAVATPLRMKFDVNLFDKFIREIINIGKLDDFLIKNEHDTSI